MRRERGDGNGEPCCDRRNGSELVSNDSMSSYRFRVRANRQARKKDDERNWSCGYPNERSALRLEKGRSARDLSSTFAGTGTSSTNRTPRIPSTGSRRDLPADFDQDRGLPGGLRVLPTKRAL